MAGLDAADHLGCHMVLLDGLGQFSLGARSGLLHQRIGAGTGEEGDRVCEELARLLHATPPEYATFSLWGDVSE